MTAAEAARAPAPEAMTVGDILRSTHVAELLDDGDWWQLRVEIGSRGAAATASRWRHRNALTWSSWARSRHGDQVYADLPARRVPIAEADGDPNGRGPMP